MHGGRKTLPARDILIHGAGLMGLSLALELHHRGYGVTVADPAGPLTEASIAAAGMLAAEDPHNPPEILALARHSIALYPAWLARLEQLGGIAVPLQTLQTWQYRPDGSRLLLDEASLDPRMLAASLLAAVRATGRIRLVTEPPPQAETAIYATGAWQPASLPLRPHTARPRKGQMLRVAIPGGFVLDRVHRSEEVYVVPRTAGPQAGTALIGATVEDAGFDKGVRDEALDHLRGWATRLVPELASPAHAPTVEAWAGLRPSTADGLPLIGRLPHSGHLIATGHYRNGILLAPATAECVADRLEDRTPAVDLDAFDPARFAR